MDYSTFGPLGRSASALGFGCAPVGSRYGRRESLRALGVAYDLGINYFDVARSYGYGDAEGIVGEFIAKKRERVVVATKFGIDPPRTSPGRRLIKTIARTAFRAAPRLRVLARQSLGQQFSHRRFDAAQLTRSVETSLRQLRTDCVDVLLIHDCTLDAIDDDDLFLAMELLITAGKVCCVGASGDQAVIREALRRRPILRVGQFRQGLFHEAEGREGASPALAHVVYSPFGGEDGLATLRALQRRVQLDPSAPEEMRRKLREMSEEEAVAALAFASARGSGAATVVLAAMFTHRHIKANVRASRSELLSASDIAYLQRLTRTVMPRAVDTHGVER